MTIIATRGADDNPCQQFTDTHWDLTVQLVELLMNRWPDRAWVHRMVDQLLSAHESLSEAWRLEVDL